MSQRVLLNLGQGDWLQGFPGVTAQLWDGNSSTPIQFSGSLPPQPQLGEQYERWRSLYGLLYGDRQTRRHRNDDVPSTAGFEIEIDEDDITNVSATEFHQLGTALKLQLNQWLASSSFRPIDRKLRTYLAPHDEIRFMISAQGQKILRFPWRLWDFFEDYPRAELALSPISYHRSVKGPQQDRTHVNILAILGNADGIDVATDQAFLSALPDATVRVLAEPNLDEVTQALWNHPWDILFFAGHSASSRKGQMSEQTGYLQLNETDQMSLEQLKYGVRAAIANGLTLAIFNSCDGLGLAWNLADLNIPQVIVMREPVPDRVAHTFLKQFLKDFASHQSLYLSVRNAREKLQPLETTCPCATWLPVIVQNPAESPNTWQDLLSDSLFSARLPGISPTRLAPSLASSSPPAVPPVPPPPSTAPPPSGSLASPTPPTPKASPLLLTTTVTPLLATLLVLALRFVGLFEFSELLALDRLMHLRPAERPDQRLLVVTIGESDIKAQANQGRSLSDASLERALTLLQQHNARVIGIDVYRDYPVAEDYPNLAALLRQDEVIQSQVLGHAAPLLLPPPIVGVCKGRDPIADPAGVSPPPEFVEDLVGFSDFMEDTDGIIRRQLVSMKPDPIAECSTPYAFSARLTFLYLQAEDITPRFNQEGSLVLGQTVLPQLSARSGGYQPVDARGGQILLNYRALPSPQNIAQQVSLTQLLQGQVNPNAIADRVVLIGVTASSHSDHWATPYGASGSNKTAGVFIQAQMTSQLLSAVLDQRPLLRPTSVGLDILWIGGWAMVGSAIAFLASKIRGQTHEDRSRHYLWIIGSVTLGVASLGGSCLWLLVQGYWVPFIPAVISFLGSSGGGLFMMMSRHDKSLLKPISAELE